MPSEPCGTRLKTKPRPAAMDSLAAIEAAHAAALQAITAWLGHGLPASPGRGTTAGDHGQWRSRSRRDRRSESLSRSVARRVRGRVRTDRGVGRTSIRPGAASRRIRLLPGSQPSPRAVGSTSRIGHDRNRMGVCSGVGCALGGPIMERLAMTFPGCLRFPVSGRRFATPACGRGRHGTSTSTWRARKRRGESSVGPLE